MTPFDGLDNLKLVNIGRKETFQVNENAGRSIGMLHHIVNQFRHSSWLIANRVDDLRK